MNAPRFQFALLLAALVLVSGANVACAEDARARSEHHVAAPSMLLAAARRSPSAHATEAPAHAAETERSAGSHAAHDAGTQVADAGTAHAAEAVAEHAESETVAGGSIDPVVAELLEGNRRFVAGVSHDRDFIAMRKELAAGQHPCAIVVTCADSRLCPEFIFDQDLGRLFVIRVAGNVTDAVALGSIEYAVDHLDVRVLIVLGHEKCGAVAAAASGERMPSPYLAAITRRISPALEMLEVGSDRDAYLRQAAAANVLRSAREIVLSSDILARRAIAKELLVVPAMYRLETGEVVPLN